VTQQVLAAATRGVRWAVDGLKTGGDCTGWGRGYLASGGCKSPFSLRISRPTVAKRRAKLGPKIACCGLLTATDFSREDFGQGGLRRCVVKDEHGGTTATVKDRGTTAGRNVPPIRGESPSHKRTQFTDPIGQQCRDNPA
jgi:hypothetical protein